MILTDPQEINAMFSNLGITDCTTKRQRAQGTQVFELPFEYKTKRADKHQVRLAIYKSGYVRNVTKAMGGVYQLNKKKKVFGTYTMSGKDYPCIQWERQLIHNYEWRMTYLANFIVNNFYKKTFKYNSDSPSEVTLVQKPVYSRYKALRVGNRSIKIDGFKFSNYEN